VNYPFNKLYSLSIVNKAVSTATHISAINKLTMLGLISSS